MDYGGSILFQIWAIGQGDSTWYTIDLTEEGKYIRID